ncbi:MAG TPA: SEC-C metal-binding domain-containing protein [Terriglobales bacterium]|nr:SEC-C metal-binding domain-containing protein [Terriglobales bacterium]
MTAARAVKTGAPGEGLTEARRTGDRLALKAPVVEFCSAIRTVLRPNFIDELLIDRDQHPVQPVIHQWVHRQSPFLEYIAAIMSKIGRNELCPCGSGRKYKACCLQKDEAVRRTEREAGNAALAAEIEASRVAIAAPLRRQRQSEQAAEDAWALITDKRFEEAEVAARAYIEEFPETGIGYELMSLLCEARGEPQAAAHWARQVIEFMRAHPDLFSSKDERQFQRRIERLDPTPVT